LTWLIPFGVTILVLGGAFWIDRSDQSYREVTQIITFCLYLIAIIVSLAAWLVWAVVT
jgi:hypothetical protein